MSAELGKVTLNPNFGRELAASGLLDAALEEKTHKIAAIARDTAPVGDEDDPHAGRYRDSIHAEVATENGRRVGKVIADAPESGFVEFGTVNNAAYHTLQNAAERAK